MNHKSLLGPILLRFAFFAINLLVAIRITSAGGWNIFSILLVFFATRDFVHGVRLGQVYHHIQKGKRDDNDENNIE